jgi:CobN/Magnesium Chelatase
VYGYWNEGGQKNVVEMMLYIASRFFSSTPIPTTPPTSTPQTGCLHPDYAGYFETPKQYLAWYEQHGTLRGTDAPVAAVLLYRKHVITSQPYIVQLIRQMEVEGVIPVPIFLNGVEVRPSFGLHAFVTICASAAACQFLVGFCHCNLTQRAATGAYCGEGSADHHTRAGCSSIWCSAAFERTATRCCKGVQKREQFLCQLILVVG